MTEKEARLLTRTERIELRHYLQFLSEHARSARNALDPVSGVLAITDQAWLGQWRALTKDLDSITERIMK